MLRQPIIVFDTETTGRDATQCGILTLGAVVLTPELEIERPLTIRQYIDPEKVLCEPQAFMVNNINLEEHNSRPDTLLPRDAQLCFHDYVRNVKLDYGMRFDSPIRFMGWNVAFDLAFLEKFQANLYQNPLAITFAGAKIDVQSDINRLYLEGKIDCRAVKLDKVADYFGIPLQAHDALEDATATAKIYKIIRNL